MWADIGAWFQSAAGARVVQSAVIPALAILVAGALAALIGRAAVVAAIRRADREQAATAVAGLVEAARAAAEGDGSRGDRRRAARLRTEADVRVRLLPLPGAARAADWSAARTARLIGSPDAGREVAALRDALIEWVGAPRRAKRLFPVQAAPTSAPVSLQGLADEEVPAWRRTKSAERLQQQHDARAADEAPSDDTAPVRLQRVHRAEAPAPEVDAPARSRTPAETRAGRFARPVERPTAAAETSAEAVAPRAESEPREQDERRDQAGERPAKPEWLDDYDDEAHVTQTMNLKTPPPVSASAVRDRAPATGIVPRP